MARPRRVGCIGIPQHVIQRGNNRNVCFADEQDFMVYANCLKQYSQANNIAVHA